jgi:hypothetical protein
MLRNFVVKILHKLKVEKLHSVNTAMGWMSGFNLQQEQEIFLFSRVVRLALGPT